MLARPARPGRGSHPRGPAVLCALAFVCAGVLFWALAGASPVEAARPAAGDAGGSRGSVELWDQQPDAGAALWDQVVRAFVVVSVGIVLAVAALLLFEDRFVFHPTHQPVAGWQPGGLGVTECTFRARDGTRLHGWWHPGEGLDDPDRRPVVLWFHGNAGNITHRAENLRAFAAAGLAVFLFDYRGYGRSEGRPSEVGLYLDGEATHRHLTNELGIAADQIVCFGR